MQNNERRRIKQRSGLKQEDLARLQTFLAKLCPNHKETVDSAARLFTGRDGRMRSKHFQAL
jgi:hypothetical protein